MTEDPPVVAAIVLNYNGVAFLDRCLTSLLNQTFEHLEITVVDNGSTDGSVDYVRSKYPHVHLVESSTNVGYSAGNNLGATRAAASYLLFLNNDATLEPDAIRVLYEHMRSDARIAACQPKIRNFAHPERFDYAGGAGGYVDFFGYPFCRGRIGDVLEVDFGQYDDVRQVFWASGAALMIRRDAFLELGGFDDRFFLYADEIDLCWRAWLFGWTVEVVPRAVAYHVGGGTLAETSPLRVYYHLRNSLAMFLKNLRALPLFALIPSRAVLDAGAALFFAVRGRWSHAISVGRAYVDLVPMLPYVVRWRREIQRRRRLGDRAILVRMYPGSIALSHVFRRIRTFTALGWPPGDSKSIRAAEGSQRSS